MGAVLYPPTKDGGGRKPKPLNKARYSSCSKGFRPQPMGEKICELPRNLTSRNLSANVPLQEVEVFTTEEITQLLNKASERKQLYLLLMMNCGMYPSDIGALRQDEVNWSKGVITRKRSKTKDRGGNVPKVEYPLWKATLDLLRKHRSKDKTLVLLNTDGKPLWRYVERNGKVMKLTNVGVAYFQLQEAIGLTKQQRKPLKAIRKTSSSMLGKHPEYGKFAQYFLGQAPDSVADRYYVKPSQEQFNSAIQWLGTQYGL